MSVVGNPIMLDMPDHFETERLLIRGPRYGDSQYLHAGTVESLEALRPWMEWAEKEQDIYEVELLVRQMMAKFILREEFMLLIFDRVTGEFIGATGMHSIDWTVPRFEVGYWVRTSKQGQGYITEAVNGVAAFAFETLKAERLEIRCDSRNERSAAVARRAGFTLEATFRREARNKDGDLRDTLVFARIRGD